MSGPAQGRRRRGRSDGRPASARHRRPLPDPARAAAFELLRAVDEQEAYANLTLPGLLAERRLGGRDAAFATELGYGTLRGLGTYDAVLDACLDRSVADLDPPVRDLLRLGVHQALAMRTPSHAAVSASVDLCRSLIGHGPAGLVNAVLRRVCARDLDSWIDGLAPPIEADPAGHLALRHAHPRWIVNATADALDGDWAETAAALAANNRAPRVTLVARPGRAERGTLLTGGAQPTPYSPWGVILEGGNPAELDAVLQRAAAVQDEGSQLMALAVAGVALDGPDRAWLDMCAGPGGKAGVLAGLAAQRGARLLAAEIAPHRARLVAATLAQPPGADRQSRTVPPHTRVIVADGTAPPWPAASFDRVLLDAPCTGLGALRRRPEARWRRQPGDVGRLMDLQQRLLVSGLAAVRPGGVLAYVTCSPHLAETRAVVATAIRAADTSGIRVETVDARPILGQVPDVGAGPHVQLWPHRHGTDAMFLAVLRRVR